MTPVCYCKEPNIVNDSEGNILCNNCKSYYSVKHGSKPVPTNSSNNAFTKASEQPSEQKAVLTCKRCQGTGLERAGFNSKRKKECRCISDGKKRAWDKHDKEMKRNSYMRS